MPDGLDLRTAALTEPLAIALRAVRRGGVQPGDRALVTGAGSIGMLAVAVLADLGAEVTVSEPSAVRRERALRIGAREVWAPGATAVPDGPYDVVVLAEGHSVDELGRMIVSKIQYVPGITRTVTCSVVNL